MSEQNILIGGEVVGPGEAYELWRSTLMHEAMETAGRFYERKRSAKFRANWPSDKEYVAANWKNFFEEARKKLPTKLVNPLISLKDKQKIYIVILLDRAFEAGRKMIGVESDTSLQIASNSQQFDGDSRENKKIADRFGDRPNFRARLKAGAAKMGSLH